MRTCIYECVCVSSQWQQHQEEGLWETGEVTSPKGGTGEVKAKMVPFMIGALGSMTPKLWDWLQ